MKEKINLIVKTTKPITEKVICDVCGKTIADRNNRDAEYWTLTTGHNDWGNDSCDSYEDFDLCSKDCVKEKLNKYFDDCERSHTQEFALRQTTISIDISELKEGRE